MCTNLSERRFQRLSFDCALPPAAPTLPPVVAGLPPVVVALSPVAVALPLAVVCLLRVSALAVHLQVVDVRPRDRVRCAQHVCDWGAVWYRGMPRYEREAVLAKCFPDMTDWVQRNWKLEQGTGMRGFTML